MAQILCGLSYEVSSIFVTKLGPLSYSFFSWIHRHYTPVALLSQGVDLTNLLTGISRVGYFWTTQKYFATVRKPKKILSEKQSPKKYPLKHYLFRKSQAWYDNNGDPWLLTHLVSKTGPKNTVENMKHFKVQLSFTNRRKYSSCDQYPKNTGSRNSKPKNILRWSLSVKMLSPPPGLVVMLWQHQRLVYRKILHLILYYLSISTLSWDDSSQLNIFIA